MTCCDDKENHRLDTYTGLTDCTSCGAVVGADPNPTEALIDALGKVEPGAILLEPRDIYDKAIVGITCDPRDGWDRPNPSPWVVVYSETRAIEALAAIEHTTTEKEYNEALHAAAEWVSYNSMGAWMGSHTPTWQTAGRCGECDQ